MAADHVKLTKAVELLNQKGLNGLIVYSNGAANILRPNYLHYFSGCKPLGSRNAAVISKSGDVAAARDAGIGRGAFLFEELDQGRERHVAVGVRE